MTKQVPEALKKGQRGSAMSALEFANNQQQQTQRQNKESYRAAKSPTMAKKQTPAADLKQENTKLRKDLEQKTSELQAMTTALKQSQEVIRSQNNDMMALKQKIQDTMQNMKTKSGRRKNGIAHLNKELVMIVTNTTTDHLWRIYKFLTSPTHEKKATTELLKKFLPSKLPEGMTDNEFIADYHVVVKDAINGRRNYHQSRAKEAAKIWWTQNGKTLPTVEEVKNVWDFDPKNATEEQKKLLLWFLDKLMPMVAGADNGYYGPHNRYYKKLTDIVKFGKFERTMLSPSTEAFAMAAYENNYEKWVKQFTWQDKNPGARLPTKGPEADELNTAKWSSNKKGQTEGGWSKEGFEAYNAYLEQVKTMRAEDITAAKHKLAYDLMRKANGKKAESAEQEQKNGGRKRKFACVAPPENEPEQLVVDDEDV